MLSHKMDFNCCANRDGFRIDSHICGKILEWEMGKFAIYQVLATDQYFFRISLCSYTYPPSEIQISLFAIALITPPNFPMYSSRPMLPQHNVRLHLM